MSCVDPRTPYTSDNTKTPNDGYFAVHKRDFLAHASGQANNHCADQINMNPPLTLLVGDNVQEALEAADAAISGAISAGVLSFEGRTGAVISASGDYNTTEITNSSTVPGGTTTLALNYLSALATGKMTSFEGRTGVVISASGDYNTTEITNSSTVAGANLTLALNALNLLSNHSSLTNLNSDDHSQYILATRPDNGGADDGKVLTAQIDGTAIWSSLSITHSALLGLGVDDHKQYITGNRATPITEEGYVLTARADGYAIWSAPASIGIGIPVGGIIDWPYSISIPTGYLECNGAAVSRTTYSDLDTIAAAMAYAAPFGPGNGSTTFNVPDMRGRVSIGAGAGSGLTPRTLGQTGGEETHILTIPEMPAHTHSLGTVMNGATGPYSMINSGTGATTTGSTGGGTAHNNMQPYTVMRKIIYAGA